MVPLGFSLDGRVAVVTGGSKGIGLAVATGLAVLGANVVIVARDIRRLEAAADHIERAAKRPAVTVATDANDQRGMDRIVETVKSNFGAVDVLVNGIGGSRGPGFRARYLSNLSEGDIANCLTFNLSSHLFMSRLLVPYMADRGGGSIINIGSAIGQAYLSPLNGNAMYASAKAALIQLTRYMAIEWAPSVRVNCIAPGLVTTEASTERVDGGGQSRLLDRMALDRLGVPEDIVGAAMLLASDAGSWITGATIDVNGGMGLTAVF
jgi:NAD(P)-dependent dehydrogenase (short-subunit alcohol dehydrogenase family)